MKPRAILKRLLETVHLHSASVRLRLWIFGKDDKERSYIASLGWLAGRRSYRLFYNTEHPDKPVILRMSGLARPITLRPSEVDRLVFEQVFVERQYEIEPSQRPSLIIDGGAHIGLASIFLARKFPKAIIYAIEPDPANYSLLCDNVAQFRRIIPMRAALWSKSSSLTIANPNSASWAFRVTDQRDDKDPVVLGITVDELLTWSGAPCIDILKLDVEGAEREIFSAECNWLRRTRAIFVELHDRFVSGCSEAFERAVAPYSWDRSTSGECIVLRELLLP